MGGIETADGGSEIKELKQLVESLQKEVIRLNGQTILGRPSPHTDPPIL